MVGDEVSGTRFRCEEKTLLLLLFRGKKGRRKGLPHVTLTLILFVEFLDDFGDELRLQIFEGAGDRFGHPRIVSR